MSGVDVLAVMAELRSMARRNETYSFPVVDEARAAVAELIVEAQRVVDGTTDDLHYLRAALARVGGAA